MTKRIDLAETEQRLERLQQKKERLEGVIRGKALEIFNSGMFEYLIGHFCKEISKSEPMNSYYISNKFFNIPPEFIAEYYLISKNTVYSAIRDMKEILTSFSGKVLSLKKLESNKARIEKIQSMALEQKLLTEYFRLKRRIARVEGVILRQKQLSIAAWK